MKTLLLLLLSLIVAIAALPARAASVTFGNSDNGAMLTGEFTSALNGTQWIAGVDGKATGYVFGKSIPIGSGTAKLTVTKNQSRSRVQANLKAAGRTLVSVDKSIANSGTFRTSNFYTAETGGRMSFGLLGFTFRLVGHANMQAYVDGNMNIGWSTNHPPVIQSKFGPALDAAASGSFEVGFIIGSAGIDGSLKLTGYGVYADVKMTPRTGSGLNQADVIWKASWDRLSTSGKLTIWVKALGFKKSKTIFSYSGGPSSTTLGQGTLRLN